jgi:hypothetical protein
VVPAAEVIGTLIERADGHSAAGNGSLSASEFQESHSTSVSYDGQYSSSSNVRSNVMRVTLASTTDSPVPPENGLAARRAGPSRCHPRPRLGARKPPTTTGNGQHRSRLVHGTHVRSEPVTATCKDESLGLAAPGGLLTLAHCGQLATYLLTAICTVWVACRGRLPGRLG